eukprot:1178357-Prorocentrum_minimum.AAC.3
MHGASLVSERPLLRRRFSSLISSLISSRFVFAKPSPARLSTAALFGVPVGLRGFLLSLDRPKILLPFPFDWLSTSDSLTRPSDILDTRDDTLDNTLDILGSLSCHLPGLSLAPAVLLPFASSPPVVPSGGGGGTCPPNRPRKSQTERVEPRPPMCDREPIPRLPFADAKATGRDETVRSSHTKRPRHADFASEGSKGHVPA